jgi:uncharacterized protein (TIGR02246 family)
MKTGSIVLALVVSATVLAGGQQRTISAADYAEIRQLYARTGMALDSGAEGGQAYARLFTADASVQDEKGATIAGRDRLAAFAKGDAPKAATDMHHYIYNVRVDTPANGSVIGQAYVVVATLGAQGQPMSVAAGGKYLDELVKTSDGWRIKSRKFTPAVGQTAPAAPAPAPVGRR